MKFKSDQKQRSDLIKKCESLLFKILLLERGKMCELCGGRQNLGLFHVVSKKQYPKLRLVKTNLLIAGWYCCHYPWHQNPYFARDIILPKIKQLRGENFEEELKVLNISATRLSFHFLSLEYLALQEELKKLETKSN